MANKSCSCSRFFSCFCCFSRGNAPDEVASSSDVPALLTEAPPVGSSSSAVEEGNVDVDLDALMEHISQLLERMKEGNKSSQKRINTAQQYLPATSKTFNKLKDFLSEATNFVKDIIPGTPIKAVASGILQGMGMAHLVIAGLVVVADILERFDDVDANKTECLRLLREMIFLAKLVKQFKERPQLKEGMDDVIKEATQLIVGGSIQCLSQMKSSKYSKFFSTSKDKEDLERFRKELDDQYKHIYVQMGISIFDAKALVDAKAHLSRRYPEHAVGIEESVKEVISLLDWGSEKNAIAIMLHAFGGMGKTTLADAVFSVLDVKGCKYSKVQLFKKIGSTPDIVELQRQILKDLMEPQDSIPDIRTPEDGRGELGHALEKATAFIYIDNVLGENELRELLPQDMNKAKKVRLLLTARDKNVGRACPVKTLIYRMGTISYAEAMSLLQKEMSNGIAGKLNAAQLQQIIEICGGIPLMLTLVAGVIRFEEDKQRAYRIVMQDREKLKGQTFENKEHYFFAYDSLPDTSKDSFLDICSFFSGWDWNTVADIVGESELDILEKRALLTKDIDGAACIHDVISTIGLQKTQKKRFKFTSASELEELLHDNKNEDKCIQAIKGIWMSENKDPLNLNASKLELMHSSLRVLALGNSIKVVGKCEKVFENLVFFQAGIPHLPFDMSKVKKLRYLSYNPATLDLPQMPSNLKHIEFHGSLHSDASEISSRCLRQPHNLRVLRLISFVKLTKLPKELGDLVKGLEELSLSSCESLEKLPKSTSNLQSLQVLKLDRCSNLKQLPEEFSKLQSLRVLRMDYCSSLKRLTEDFGVLNSLQELNLQGCTDLQALPNNFENLSSLKLLNLSSCTSIEELPHGLGNLTSLVTLNLNKCDKLKSIPESIGQLKLLASSMDMSHCSSLTELPDAFCNLSFITHLSLSGCKSLRRLPDRFGKLASLRVLDLEECMSMEKLPEGFGLLEFLEELNLSSCKKLEELCNDLPCLSSLRNMYLCYCECLKKLPEDFHCLVSLQRLLLCGCKCLENVPENFHHLPSLQELHLHHCPMLEGKCMDNLIKTKKLQLLYIEGSKMLLKRWTEIQREGHQSWPFIVFTGQDLSEEDAINIQKNFLSNLDGHLTHGQGEPVHLSNCPPNTSILFLLDNRPNPSSHYPWPLIEETVNDIKMIYIGEHFDKLPPKVANKILGHAPFKIGVQPLLLNLLRASQLKEEPESEANSDSDDADAGYFPNSRQWSAKMMVDRKDGKYLSCWKCLSKRKLEEFVVSKCGKYVRLKQLAETNQESNKEILREMFATIEAESTDQIFQKNCASDKVRSEDSKPLTCGIDEMKGKVILLEIRDVEACYDVRLESLAEMYITAKERLGFEIISIPIVQPSTKVDVLDIFQRFSAEVPWLVLRKPWMIQTAVKYFLLKQCSWEDDDELLKQWSWEDDDESLKQWSWEDDDEWEAGYPSIIWMIDSNGKVTYHKHFVFPMLDRWGAKCYSFEKEKIKELRREEWEKQKNMSSLEFLFMHLEKVSKQVKEILLQRKTICLYGGNQRMNEFTCSMSLTAITELRNMIHIIYIPSYDSYDGKDRKKLQLTYSNSMEYFPLKWPDISQVKMEGIPLLNLSEHEAMRFWTRLSSLKKEIREMDDRSMQLGGLKKLLDYFQRSYSWMTLMDKDGEMITDRRKEIVHNLILGDITEDREKELLLQELLHEFKQQDSEEERRFSEEPMDKEEQREFQEKIELWSSVADSIPGDLQGDPSKCESGVPSAKASPTA